MGRHVPQEFKDQIVALHREGRTAMSLSREFGIAATSVANWVRVADREAAQSGSAESVESDKARIVRLERELAGRTEELEVLGKALAFFARRQW